MILIAYSEGPDQTVRMHRLIWVFHMPEDVFEWRGRYMYSRASMAGTSLGPWKLVPDMGSLSQWGLIIAPGQDTNGDISGVFSIFYKE